MHSRHRAAILRIIHANAYRVLRARNSVPGTCHTQLEHIAQNPAHLDYAPSRRDARSGIRSELVTQPVPDEARGLIGGKLARFPRDPFYSGAWLLAKSTCRTGGRLAVSVQKFQAKASFQWLV